jgi:hypothetical protein
VENHPGAATNIAAEEVVKAVELAGIRARILSLQSVNEISGAVSGPLSLPRKIAFPDGGDRKGSLIPMISTPINGRRFTRNASTQ